MQVKETNRKLILVKTIGSIVKKYRLAQKKTIYKISAESFMSKSTWREVELGMCKDINLSTLWKIAEGLEAPLSVLIEDLQEELGEDFSITEIY